MVNCPWLVNSLDELSVNVSGRAAGCLQRFSHAVFEVQRRAPHQPASDRSVHHRRFRTLPGVKASIAAAFRHILLSLGQPVVPGRASVDRIDIHMCDPLARSPRCFNRNACDHMSRMSVTAACDRWPRWVLRREFNSRKRSTKSNRSSGCRLSCIGHDANPSRPPVR
jgi:hypothetical protein